MSRSIVIVDDSEDILELMEACFRDRQFEVHKAKNGFELMKLMRDASREPDVVVLDLMMPERSGLDLLSTVKSIWKRTKVVIYTAHEGGITQELKICADCVVLKTTPIHVLVEKIEELLKAEEGRGKK